MNDPEMGLPECSPISRTGCKLLDGLKSVCDNWAFGLLNHRHCHSVARRFRPPRRASNGVTEESMQLSANAEILRPRQIARGKPVRTDLAGLRMTMFGG